MVDCKNGESYDGKLMACDAFMNLKLGGEGNPVIITSASGETFSRCEEVFIRGNNIKTIQFAPEVLAKHQVEVKRRQAEALEAKANRRREKEDRKEASMVDKAANTMARGGRGGSQAMRGGRGGGPGNSAGAYRGGGSRGGSENRGRRGG